jgi:putative peptidoglycan lipid II flippase
VSRQLVRSAGIIGAATMTSRVLGLVRDQVLAFLFGAGDAMDAFRIAFRLPNMLRDLFAEGAMSAALVPTFTRTLVEGGRDRTWRLGSNVINVLIVISVVLVALGIVFARPLVHLYAGRFDEVPGKLDLTVQLTRIMFPFLPLVAVAAVLMAMLNALGRFFVPALSPAMFNVATIVCAIVFVPIAPQLGIDPIVAIAIGTLIGGLAQIALQWPAARREGFRYAPIIVPADPSMKEVGRLMIPGIAGLAAVQLNLFVNSWLATGLGTGAVSWLDYAFRLMYMPIGLFGVSVATAALPGISGHASSGDDGAVRRSMSASLRLMLLLNIPATIGLVVLANPIVALIFQRGRFTAADTAATAAALSFYAPGLIGYSVVKLVSPAFYAMGSSRMPVIASVMSVGFNIVASVLLARVLGHRGLALGTAMAALLNAGVLLWLFRARLGRIEGRRIATSVLKVTLASVSMGIAAYYTERLLRVSLGTATLLAQAMRVFGAIVIGVAVLAVSAHLLRIEEFRELTRPRSPAV